MQLWELMEQLLIVHLVLSRSHFKSARGKKLHVNHNKETWGWTGTHVSINTSNSDVMGNLQEKPAKYVLGPEFRKAQGEDPLRSGGPWAPLPPHTHHSSKNLGWWPMPSARHRPSEWKIWLLLQAGFQSHIKCLLWPTPTHNHTERGILRNLASS